MRNTLRENNPKLTDCEIKQQSCKGGKTDGRQTTDQNGQKDIARTEIVTAHNQATRAYIQWAE